MFGCVKSHILSRICCFLAVMIVFSSVQPADATRSIRSDPRYAAFVIDINSNTVLYSRSADRPRYPASLTKIMTLYLVFEALREGRITRETRIRFSAYAAAQPPSKLGIAVGQTISVENAIKALVTKSANDVAAAIAEHLGGTESQFAAEMTRTARALGMSNTTFKNASGLPNSAQVTTARDMARLGYAVQRDFPAEYGYFSTRSFTYNGRRYGNHNRLLGNVAGVDGIKTGYTRASGFNLTTSLRRNNRHLIAVVMGGPTGQSRDAHMRYLLDRFYSQAVARTDPPFEIDIANMQTPALRPGGTQVLMASTPSPVPALDTSRGVIAASVTVPGTTITSNSDPVVTATVTTPAPVQIAANDNANVETRIENQWVIQIGAYGDEAAARGSLSDARTAASTLLASGQAYTEIVRSNNQTLYRARFRGFDRGSAVAACQVLKNADFPCLPLPR
jgi:D-alanyl-D-alanine carboxypeptidase